MFMKDILSQIQRVPSLKGRSADARDGLGTTAVPSVRMSPMMELIPVVPPMLDNDLRIWLWELAGAGEDKGDWLLVIGYWESAENAE
jgi:hypothetical protein